MMIDFFIAGVQKSGTTALDHYLRAHPAIQMATEKEIHFFDDETLDWSKPDYTRLQSGFNWNVTGVTRGEATPIYTYWPNALKRLKQYNPAAKLIVGLRHPSFRAYSHWRMETKRGAETLPFSEAIRWPARQRVADASNSAHRVFSYVERGFYSAQVDQLLQRFRREQMLFFRTDLLWSDPTAILDQVQDFLGVDRKLKVKPSYIVPEFTWQSGGMAEDNRVYLAQLFVDDIKKTAERIGIKLDDWLEPNYLEPMRPE